MFYCLTAADHLQESFPIWMACTHTHTCTRVTFAVWVCITFTVGPPAHSLQRLCRMMLQSHSFLESGILLSLPVAVSVKVNVFLPPSIPPPTPPILLLLLSFSFCCTRQSFHLCEPPVSFYSVLFFHSPNVLWGIKIETASFFHSFSAASSCFLHFSLLFLPRNPALSRSFCLELYCVSPLPPLSPLYTSQPHVAPPSRRSWFEELWKNCLHRATAHLWGSCIPPPLNTQEKPSSTLFFLTLQFPSPVFPWPSSLLISSVLSRSITDSEDRVTVCVTDNLTASPLPLWGVFRSSSSKSSPICAFYKLDSTTFWQRWGLF